MKYVTGSKPTKYLVIVNASNSKTNYMILDTSRMTSVKEPDITK